MSSSADDVRLRAATPGDAATVIALVNGAYRGEGDAHGWTSEHELVTGDRIDAPRLEALMARPGSVVLVAERAGRVVGCVHLERGEGGACELGMLSVRVSEQASGVGRAILAQAEAHARDALGARLVTMRVIRARPELLAWYERRGYRRTGELVDFAPHGGQRFLRGPLQFERLEKRLA